MNKRKEVKATIIVIGIFILTTIINYGLSLSTKRIGIYAIEYIVVFLVFAFLSAKFLNKPIQILSNVVAIPMAIIYALLKITIPLGVVIIHVFAFALTCSLPPLIFTLINKHFELIKLSYENSLFIMLTFSSIASLLFYKDIIKLVCRYSVIGINDSEKPEKVKLKKLVEYLITPENIRFGIYFLYFIFLCVISFINLERNSISINPSYRAFMQAFLVFLAFDRLILNSKSLIILPSKLLDKILESILFEKNAENGKKLINQNKIPTQGAAHRNISKL